MINTQQTSMPPKMIFSLKDLYVGGHFSVSRQIEQIILDQLKVLYNVSDKDVEISQGCNSDYDFRILNKLFELKVMSTYHYNIEVSRFDGSKSGLSASKADYYIIINPGFLYKKEYMKIRIVDTKDLRNAIQNNSKIKIYNPNIHNQLGSICHQLDPKNIRHDFVGTFEIVEKRDYDIFIDFNAISFFPSGRFDSLYVKHSLDSI